MATKHTSIRLDERDLLKIDAMAKDQRRTRSQMIALLVSVGLEKAEAR